MSNRLKNEAGEITKPRILCLSLYYSTDRILLYTKLLEKLAEAFTPAVWSLSVSEKTFPIETANGRRFAMLTGKDSIPQWLNLVRHFNDYVWDHKGLSFSRNSIWRLIKSVTANKSERLLRKAAGIAVSIAKNLVLDTLIDRLMLRYGYCRESFSKFAHDAPDAIVSMTPFAPIQMSIVASAKKAAVPCIAYITSWDNLTTKTRMSLDYDGYIVWSESMKSELHQFYPQTRNKPVRVIGAPQYDIFHDPTHHVSRAEFLESYGLEPAARLVTYCLGSPNFIKEDYGVLDLLETLKPSAGDPLQLIVRLHPGFYEKDYKAIADVRGKYKNVIVQGTRNYFDQIPLQPEDSIREWVNTFRHSDVVVNLASTVTIDACIFDKPVINIDFDPERGRPNAQLVREINRSWNHFAPVAQSGGVWNVRDMAEMTAALGSYLENPSIHREGRRRIVELVCGSADAGAGERMAEAVGEILSSRPSIASTSNVTGVLLAN